MDPRNFVRHVGPHDVHDAKVVDVQRRGDAAIVRLESMEGRRIDITFTGVAEVRAVRPIGMMVYSLAELEAEPPQRRFAFLNWDEEGEQALEIVALSCDPIR